MEKKKRPYEKPELKGKIVFEATGGGSCCKLSQQTGCTAGVKSNQKQSAANVTS